MSTIPLSNIAGVTPGTVQAGSPSLALNGVIFSTDAFSPDFQAFSTAQAVSNWYGAGTPEAIMSAVYFAGIVNGLVLPNTLYFAKYNPTAQNAFMLSGSLASTTLAQLQAITGTLQFTVDGVASTSINVATALASATSFTQAASALQALFTSPNFTLTYNAQKQAFQVVSNNATPTSSTMTFATGTAASALLFTSGLTLALLATGRIADTPSAAFTRVYNQTQNWAAFSYAQEPTLANKLAFAAANAVYPDQFAFIAWDTDPSAANPTATTSFGNQIFALNTEGAVPVYNTPDCAALVLSYVASIDYNQTNSRTTPAFRQTLGTVAPTVTDPNTYAGMQANSYTFYGNFSGRTASYNELYQGKVSGQFKYLDTYIDQMALNTDLQNAVQQLMQSTPSLPYNSFGYGLVAASLLTPVKKYLTAGAIVAGGVLSPTQIALVNAAAGQGIDAATPIQRLGYYIQVVPATAAIRAVRGSPQVNVWYFDGGSIHKLNVNSTAVL